MVAMQNGHFRTKIVAAFRDAGYGQIAILPAVTSELAGPWQTASCLYAAAEIDARSQARGLWADAHLKISKGLASRCSARHRD